MDCENSVESRLKAVGIEIPDSSPPLASYLPFVVTKCSDSSSLVHVAGKVSIWEPSGSRIVMFTTSVPNEKDLNCIGKCAPPVFG